MAKLKDALIKHNETMREWQAQYTHRLNTHKHQPEKQQSTQTWNEQQFHEDMPDLEGQALADAEKQFDYDSWLGQHGYGEATAQDDNPYLFNPTRSKTEWLTPRTMLRLNKIKHGIGE